MGFFQLCCVNKCKTKKASDDEIKKTAGQVLTQFKEFLLTKQRTCWTIHGLGKPFTKKSKMKKNSKIQSAIFSAPLPVSSCPKPHLHLPSKITKSEQIIKNTAGKMQTRLQENKKPMKKTRTCLNYS